MTDDAATVLAYETDDLPHWQRVKSVLGTYYWECGQCGAETTTTGPYARDEPCDPCPGCGRQSWGY